MTKFFPRSLLSSHTHGQGFGSGSGWIRCVFSGLYPDPVFKFLWIRIRIRGSNISGSGSGFSPDTDPGAKKECRKSSKSYLLEEKF